MQKATAVPSSPSLPPPFAFPPLTARHTRPSCTSPLSCVPAPPPVHRPLPPPHACHAAQDAHQLCLALEQHLPRGDVPAAVAQYQRLRLARANSVQRFAAEGCGLASVRRVLRPAGLTREQLEQRGREFGAWINSYPNDPLGDPASHYWKPAAA